MSTADRKESDISAGCTSEINTKLRFLYKDDDLIAVAKPAGIHSVSHRDSELSIASLLTASDPTLAEASIERSDGGLLHRLDYHTSGILLAARARSTWLELRDKFQQKQIIKKYIALCEGCCTDKTTLETYIGSRYRRSKKVQVYSTESKKARWSQPAVSIFTPIAVNEVIRATLFEVQIITGCRHQIRAHAAYLTTPLLGDVLYGSGRTLSSLIPSFTTLNSLQYLLHSSFISLSYGNLGQNLYLAAPLPDYFRKCVEVVFPNTEVA